MSEQEKKWQRIYDLFDTETKPVSLSTVYKAMKNFFTEKELFNEKREWRIEQKNEKKAF